MAEGLNRVTLLGNIGADPELRQTGNGAAVLKLRLATSETFLDSNKQRQERTEWHRVVIWGKRAEALGRILNKGDRILIEGALRTTSYEKDGEKRFATEIVASNVVLGGRGGGSRAPSEDPEFTPEPKGGFSEDDYGTQSGDDIPF